MAVGQEEIRIAVEIGVERQRRPAERQVGRHRQPGVERGVLEQAPVEVAVERRVVVREVRHHQVEPAVAVEVGDPDAHAPLDGAVGVEGAARPGADLLEAAAPEIAVEPVRRAVVGDVEIGQAVVIEIESGHVHRVAGGLVEQPGRRGRLAEAAGAVVQVEAVRRRRQPARAVHHQHPVAPPARATGGRDVRPGGVDVTGDVEVVIAVAVGVEEGTADTPGVVARRQRLGGPVGEAAVAAVDQQDVAAERGHVEVGAAVAVDVADAAALAVDRQPGAGALADVLERAVAQVAVEPAAVAAARVPGQPVGGDEVEILIAVAVVVQAQHAVAGRLQDVRLLGATAPGHDLDAGPPGAIQEPHLSRRAGSGECEQRQRRQNAPETPAADEPGGGSHRRHAGTLPRRLRPGHLQSPTSEPTSQPAATGWWRPSLTSRGREGSRVRGGIRSNGVPLSPRGGERDRG